MISYCSLVLVNLCVCVQRCDFSRTSFLNCAPFYRREAHASVFTICTTGAILNGMQNDISW